jgi:hypothetical protein
MKQLLELLQIKKLATMILTLVFAYLAIIGKVSATEFIVVYSSVICYYFGQSSTRQAIKENK